MGNKLRRLSSRVDALERRVAELEDDDVDDHVACDLDDDDDMTAAFAAPAKRGA